MYLWSPTLSQISLKKGGSVEPPLGTNGSKSNLVT